MHFKDIHLSLIQFLSNWTIFPELFQGKLRQGN